MPQIKLQNPCQCLKLDIEGSVLLTYIEKYKDYRSPIDENVSGKLSSIKDFDENPKLNHVS